MRNGDYRVDQIISEAGQAIGKACAVVMNVLSPERIVIGGGVAGHIPELVELAAATAKQLAFRPNDVHTQIVAAQLEGTSVVYGALAMAKSAIRV
jgi:predicted NBD/HSP70 family sugar kinase